MLAGVWQSLKVKRADAVAGFGAWEALSRRAQEASGIYSPEFASALLQFNPFAELLTVIHRGEWLMALPSQQRRLYRASLATPVTPSTLPLVSKDMAQEAVQAFLYVQAAPFRFHSLPTESLFFRQLKEHAPQFKIISQWQRAALRITGSYDEWLERSFDGKRRKEWKRQRNRLGEQGRLELARLEHAIDVRRFVDEYLPLEAKGWKGRAGTALQSCDETAAQFTAFCTRLAKAGKLRFWTLKLDGRAIASLVGLVEGEQAWIFKIAYDEDYAKFSPGVLLVLDATADFFADGKIKLVDSCAIPGHPMIDRLWKDRLGFADVLVAPQKVSVTRFAATHAMLKAMLQLRARVKPLYLKLKGRKLS